MFRCKCDHKPRSRVGTRTERAAIRKKRRAVQQQQEKVVLQGVELQNVYEFKYLGFWFVADADRRYVADVSMTRLGQMWQIWGSSAFPLTTKIRLFGATGGGSLDYLY